MRIFESILDPIGGIPTLRLKELENSTGGEIWANLEAAIALALKEAVPA